MTADLADRVRDALAHRADRTTVTADARFEDRLPIADEPSGSRRVPVTVAVALVLVLGGAAGAVFTRFDAADRAVGTAPLPTAMPSTTSPTLDLAPATAPGGAAAPMVHVPEDSDFVVLDATPSENCPACSFDPEREFGPASWRVYAVDVERPERGAAIVTVGNEDIVGTPGPHGTSVLIRGVTGDIADTVGDGRQLSFFVDGYLYFITGYGVSDEQLVAIAERAEPAPDGHGVVLAPASLPSGVTLQHEGWNDAVFLSTGPTTKASLQNTETGATASFLGIPGTASANLSRLQFDSITDVEVGIFSGYVGAFDAPGTVRVLVWPNGDRTMVLRSSELTADELVSLAESLEFG